MTENEFFAKFYERCETDQHEAYLKIWKKSKIDFDEFLERPDEFREPEGGNAEGMIYYHDTVPLGKKLIAFALKLAGTVYDYKANFFIEDEGQGEDIDYNKITHFIYSHMIDDLINYIEELKEEEEDTTKEF